ncbi:hypothetical protein CPC08DRAFT_197061 [Agrocybe pediades]|nr:hypothetical protein CPC08DRAFT_197061 [Agrocybe pediades]
MPGRHLKQVRFAYQNTFHSPAPMPPLTFSASTNPSSKGPITPPSGGHVLPAYAPNPILKYPSSSSSRYSSSKVRVHPYLEEGGINWDLMDHPSSISRNHHSLSSRALCEPATNPPMPSIVIYSPYLPWSIKVRPSNGSYITLEDVLDSVYRSLRSNVMQQDFGSLPSAKEQRRATEAYERRYRRIRHERLYQEEKRGGMKRVDFLMCRTRFLGLVNNGRRPDEWQLKVT